VSEGTDEPVSAERPPEAEVGESNPREAAQTPTPESPETSGDTVDRASGGGFRPGVEDSLWAFAIAAVLAALIYLFIKYALRLEPNGICVTGAAGVVVLLGLWILRPTAAGTIRNVMKSIGRVIAALLGGLVAVTLVPRVTGPIVQLPPPGGISVTIESPQGHVDLTVRSGRWGFEVQGQVHGLRDTDEVILYVNPGKGPEGWYYQLAAAASVSAVRVQEDGTWSARCTVGSPGYPPEPDDPPVSVRAVVVPKGTADAALETALDDPDRPVAEPPAGEASDQVDGIGIGVPED